MTLTIGRVSLSRDPGYLSYDGDRLDAAGWFYGTTFNHANVIREQMLGLDNNEDEPDVPVTWSGDDALDGYYTVGGVNVTPVRGVTYQKFGFQYSIQLKRVQGGFAAPLCEVAASFALRTNAHAVTTATSVLSVRNTATFKQAQDASGSFSGLTSGRSGETGSLETFLLSVPSASFLAATFAIPPVDYYDMSVMIEQSVDGVWYPVVGDQIGNVTGNLLRLSNGIVRSTFHTDDVISMQMYDAFTALAWESTTSFRLTSSGGVGDWAAEGGWRIIRNSPECCVIQTSAMTQTGSSKRTVTFSLNRGEMLVMIAADRLYYPLIGGGALDTPVTLEAATNTAATSLTGGIRQTSDDASGNRWMMMCPSSVTKDLVNGKLTIAAPGVPLTAQFGLGFELAGSASTTVYDAVTIATEFFVATGLRQRVVAR